MGRLRNPIVVASVLATLAGTVALTVAIFLWINGGRTVPPPIPFDNTASGTAWGTSLNRDANGIYQIAELGEPWGAIGVRDLDSEGLQNIPLRGSPIVPSRIRNVLAVPFNDGRSFHVWFEVRGLYFTVPSRHLAIVDHGWVRYTARAVTLGSMWRIDVPLAPDEVLEVRRLLLHGGPVPAADSRPEPPR